MARLIGDFDWSQSPLGPRGSWPGALKNAVSICLGSGLPMFVWWGPDLINIYNDAYAPVLGKRHPRALGQPAKKIWSEIWPDIGDDVLAVVQRGEPIIKERVRLVLERNGYPEETFFTYSHSPIIDEHGTIRGLFQVCIDETARVIAERERGHLAEQRQLALDAAQMGWWHYDPQTKIATFDERFAQIFGVTGSPTPNDEILKKIHPDDAPGNWSKVEAALDPIHPQPFSSTYRIIRDGGSIRWIEAHGLASFDGEGDQRRASSFVGTVTDITERRLIDNRAKTVLESITDAFFAVDKEWRFSYVNSRAETMLNRQPGDLLGKVICEAYPGLVGSEFEKMYHGVVTERAAASLTSFYPDHNRWYEVHAYPAADGGISIYFRDVSERMRAEAALRESTSLLKGISDSTRDAIFAKDREGRLRFANPATLRALGKTLEQALGKTNDQAIDDPTAAAAMNVNDMQVMTTGVAADFEEIIPQPDGTSRIWLSRKMPNFDAAGNIVGILGVARDITDEKNAAAAMREMVDRVERQGRLFERIASSTPDFIYVFDLAGRFIYANRRLLEVWGTTLEQAVGKNLYELGYPTWHADMHMRELTHVIETRQPIKGEVPFTGGSGISGVYEYIFTPVLDPDGNVEVIAGTTRDVTDRLATQRALQESEARFRQLADAMPQIVWAAQANGVLDYYNRRWFEFVGVPAETPIESIAWDRYVHPEDLQRVYQDWASSIQAGQAYKSEFRVRNAQGHYLWFLVRAEPARDPSGQIVRWYGTCTDITDRKRSEEERQTLLEVERTARGEAERTSQMKDEFLATLSHELRTPLNAILGWATILSSGNPTPEDLRDGLETIQRNARAQTQIIEDLLDMSRIISGKVRLEVQRTDLAQVLQAAVDTVRPAADARGVRLRAVLDPHSGPVSGDPGRLQQVFWNLLSNAVKFTPRGGQVQVLLERVNSHVEVTVTDTGEGISPEFLPHVFDRFRQADASTTRRHGGLGLGLAIVKQLVELHGGTVRVKSPGKNQGSTFSVHLPLTVIHPELDDDQQNRRHPDSADDEPGVDERVRLAGIKIVVVDDEPDARTLMKRVLGDCDAIVRVAASADEALRLIAAELPDVLISDIGMPGEDGYALIRKIRALPPDRGRSLPAIALTAYARTDDRIRAIRSGFQTHITKPVNPLELITIVASLAARDRK